MKTTQHLVLSGALVLALTGGSATASFAESDHGSSDAPSMYHGRMMEGMGRGQMGLDRGEAMDGAEPGGKSPGADPELRQLAEAIIEAQEAEVAFLEAWLDARAE